MADGGELAAAFRALAEDAAQAGEDIGAAESRFFLETAENEDAAVETDLAADAENARALDGIRPDAGHLGDLDNGSAGAGGSRIDDLLNGDGDAGAAEDAPALLRAGGGGARLPMSMDTVNSVAGKYGIDISENDISINKAVAGLRGSTAPDQSITLYRGAFQDEEQLAKTLVHEQWHVAQLQAGLPYPASYDAASAAEVEAENFANAWWDSLIGG